MMEFVDESCGSRDGYGESEDETLSFCDLPISGKTEISAEWESSMRNSSIEFLEHQDFNFDLGFDLGRSISTEFHSCPADDLFYDGHLLPLSKSNAQFSSSESSSFGENRILLTEKLQSWRSDSLDSRSSYWTSSSSNNSQASHGNFNYSASQRRNCRHVNSESKPRRSSSTSPKPPHWCTKRSLKWQQFFAVGIISKAPVMQLDDMRLRQQKSLKNRYIEQSVNGKMSGETPRAKGWMKLVTLTSLNVCMGSVKSVIHCTTVKKPINGRTLSH